MFKRHIHAGLFIALAAASALSACDGPGSERAAGGATPTERREARSSTCYWDGAEVHSGEWLECDDCVWQYCQCQHDGHWGHCTNEPPHDGACDWTDPDWSDPACSEGGRKPCDWEAPDWTNPACQDTPPPGTDKTCFTCHTDGPPPGTPPPHIHTWL
jgi:hypothetical protein